MPLIVLKTVFAIVVITPFVLSVSFKASVFRNAFNCLSSFSLGLLSSRPPSPSEEGRGEGTVFVVCLFLCSAGTANANHGPLSKVKNGGVAVAGKAVNVTKAVVGKAKKVTGKVAKAVVGG